MHLQHNRLPCLPPALRFSVLWLGHAQKSKFWDSFWRREWPTSIEFFFHCSFFSFSFFFAAVIGLLLGLMQLKKLPRKCHWDGQIWPWTFSLNFLSILVHISGSIRPITLTWASLEGSFPSAEVDHRWCQFGQKWWCQKWKKGPGSSQPVMADLGVNGLIFNLKFYALMSYDHLLMGQSWASCVRSY